MTNALIQADALGIFAREGLDLATRWALSNDGPLVDDAFLLYRNYDGNHSTAGLAYRVPARTVRPGDLVFVVVSSVMRICL